MYTVAIQGKVWGLVNLLYCLFILMRTYASRLTNDCMTSTVTLQMALHPNPRRTQNASEKRKKKIYLCIYDPLIWRNLAASMFLLSLKRFEKHG